MHNYTTGIYRLGSIMFTAVLLSVAPSAHAAELSFVANQAPKMGHDIVVEVFLDTKQEMMNAIEGGVVIPPTLAVRDVRFDGSIVSLWITRPNVDSTGLLTFAGLVPGGYQGTPEKLGRGNVMTLVLRPTQEGAAELAFSPLTTVLLNDGEGTRAELSRIPLRLSVLSADGSPEESVLAEDVESPLAFTPQIVDGKPYELDGKVLVFDAQDKVSGVVGYEVAFSTLRTSDYVSLVWQEAVSPYVLSESQLTQYVYVRAVDTQGNFRVAVLSPFHFSWIAFMYGWVWYVIAVALILLVSYRHWFRAKRA